MQIIIKCVCRGYSGHLKTLKIMRLSMLLFLLGTLQMTAENSVAGIANENHPIDRQIVFDPAGEETVQQATGIRAG